MYDTFKKFDLKGRTALITGGATGIGYYMARGLSGAGARVMICARREDVLKDAASRLNAETGNEVCYHTVDLLRPESVRRLIEHAGDKLDGVDILIGNAALLTIEPIDAIKDDTMADMMQVNVMANIALTRGFVPNMRRKKWGRIIFSSSTSSIHGSANETASVYSTVKGALNSFVHAAAAELGRDGITVNSLVLGMHMTDMVKALEAELDARDGAGAGKAWLGSQADMTALGRLAECEEIEGVIQMLASNAGGNITGSNLVVDGGLTIMMRPYDPAPAGA